MGHRRLRLLLIGLWLAVVGATIYAFLTRREALQHALADASSASFLAGAAVYLVFGCLRGFTLIPSTTLVVAAIPVFPPVPLFLLTLAGILISSSSIYFFAESLHLEEVFAGLHSERMARLRAAMTRYELPVIIGWSFFPLAPTDLICYVCGIYGVRFLKCVVGVAIGEGAICAIYIFFGDWFLRLIHLR